MSYNLFDILKDEVTGNAEHVDQQTYIDRLATCESCDNAVQLIPLTGKTCKICWCFVKEKAKYKPSECPEKKWLSVALKPVTRN